MSGNAFTSFMKHRPAEIFPVIAVTGFAVALCVGSVIRTWGPARAQWTVAGRHPELRIDEGQQTKLMAVNQKYEK
ncbi:hypothetical protein SARC_09896 [Sphaeroforma arctica JP610]|uniref:Uncharacterized protein n=1 Tax=Sphaeroforma arctica JP610 TaxID=667725 RepID=A0A0L0FMD5_9EUKA|nr:hypothetical protein SARC_09896 [Sphaeroforma arctica JP610]KNC77646.1 hypothetical protein SARC_09896 [Sphaeroforma arctica JP610]|eukprot:XP_014151548.1 hypothetical protein SARC_09896 [Sphaeroforma arctica JP610]